MADQLVAAWLDPVPEGTVHRVFIEGIGVRGAKRLETLCGIKAVGVRLADDEPVDCEPCLVADGAPWVEYATELLARLGKPVTA